MEGEVAGDDKEQVEKIKGFWDSQFSEDGEREWIAPWDLIKPIVTPYLVTEAVSEGGGEHDGDVGLPNVKCVLNVGCGTSRLGLDMKEASSGPIAVVNSDISPVAIDLMQKKYPSDTNPGISWQVADATDLTATYNKGQFDVVVDKGTSDTFLFRADRKSPLIKKMLDGVAEILTDKGVFICISPRKHAGRMLSDERYGWTVRSTKLVLADESVPSALEQSRKALKRPRALVYVHVCDRGRRIERIATKKPQAAVVKLTRNDAIRSGKVLQERIHNSDEVKTVEDLVKTPTTDLDDTPLLLFATIHVKRVASKRKVFYDLAPMKRDGDHHSDQSGVDILQVISAVDLTTDFGVNFGIRKGDRVVVRGAFPGKAGGEDMTEKVRRTLRVFDIGLFHG